MSPTLPPAAGHRRIAQTLGGPASTLALMIVIEALRHTPLQLPEPGAVMLLVVAGSSYAGGWLPGTISALAAIAYTTWFFSSPEAARLPDAFGHQVVTAVGAPLLVVLLSLLRRHMDRLRTAEREATAAQGYQRIFEEASEPILVVDRESRLLFVNQKACDLAGRPRDELLGMRQHSLYSPESQARLPSQVGEILRRGELTIEREILRPDGARVQVEVSSRTLQGEHIISIIRDVTEERAGVERLQQALSLVQATLESTTDGILVVDGAGRWVTWNRKFLEIWHVPEEISAARDDERALAWVLAELAEPQVFIDRVRALYAEPDASSFEEVPMRDGRVLERYSIPQRIDDRIVGRVWSFRDVTEGRRQAQALRDTEKRLLETEKLEAVGRLAGGVAHDFNNMLTAILGEADLILQQPALERQTRAQVENIRNAALRSAQLTRQLLAFARRQPYEARTLDLAALVGGLEPLMRRLAGQHVSVRLELPSAGPGPWVHADPAQLEQAILNLVINAGDAMPDGGALVLRVDRVELSAADAAQRGARAAGPHACLTVSDTGTGIPEHVRPHLFEPFFTTKPEGKGTGLGLASVHGTIEQAKGFIEVESLSERGTMFRVLVPECAPPPAPLGAPLASQRPEPAAGGTSVLVVDDEPQVRRFVATVLAQAGFEVLEAANPAEAFALLRSRGKPVSLLVSDVVMPGGSGPQLARVLREQGLAEHVLLMSGYSGEVAESELGPGASIRVVAKPFRSAELLERVRACLAGN